MMNAPTYLPAKRFKQPSAVPFVFGIELVSLAELQGIPAAWAVVTKHEPLFNVLVNVPTIKPFLTNMTVESFVTYGLLKQEIVDQIDADLRKIPYQAWSAL